MSTSVACPVCGRRLKLPDGFAARKARCPGCRTKFNPHDPTAPLPKRKTAAAVTAPARPTPAPLAPPAPAPLPLSLDDAPLSLDDAAEAEPVPEWWLLGIGAALAVGAAAGPLVLGMATDLGFLAGFVAAVAAAWAALGANAAVVLRTRLAPAAKVGVMSGVCAVVSAAALVGLNAYLGGKTPPLDETAGASTPATPQAAPPPGPPLVTPLPPLGPDTDRPPTHIDLAVKFGSARIDDGPAEVTALAMVPGRHDVMIGYANGVTRIQSLDSPAFDPPRDGPRADGPVRRIDFDPPGRLVYLTCPGGVVAAPRERSAGSFVKLPGEFVAVFPEPGRERFAAVRGGRVHVRDVPLRLVRDHAGRKAVKGFVTPTTGKGGDEVPAAGVRVDYLLPPGQMAFLAWHPTGRLLGGTADGTVVSWAVAGPRFEVASVAHKAGVRTWAAAVGTWDFATGDEDGTVGVWPDKALKPAVFRATNSPVVGLSFDTWGDRLAVADAGGEVAVWALATNKTTFVKKWPSRPPAVAFGPTDDVLLVADGKGVEVVWLPPPEG
jgi:hypothetical protein